MQRGFGGTAFEPAERQRDKEVTLSPAMLVGLAAGLAAVCGLCFLAGYAVGHHSSGAPDADATQANGGPSAAQILSTQSKPSASQGSAQPPAMNPQSSTSGEASSADGAQPAASGQVVQTALPGQTGTGAGQSASLPATAWMVQIAEGFHPEDAEVLVDALRRRGYTASAHRDPSDGLIHVRMGPFPTHDAAAATRQKLSNDGYNAIIQP